MKSVYSLLLVVMCLLINEATAMDNNNNRRRSYSDSAPVKKKKVVWAKNLEEIKKVSPHKDHAAYISMCDNIRKNKQAGKKIREKAEQKERRLTIFEVDENRVDNKNENQALLLQDWFSEEVPTFDAEAELELELKVGNEVYKGNIQFNSDKK